MRIFRDVDNMLDCYIVESEFEIHLHNYVHYRSNSFEKNIDYIILLAQSAEAVKYNDCIFAEG